MRKRKQQRNTSGPILGELMDLYVGLELFLIQILDRENSLQRKAW
jgi:hypothetical protein